MRPEQNLSASAEGISKRCLADLRVTDPRDDKKRIQDTKGGLLKDSYRWILDNADFRRWRRDVDSRLLWIKGDPGKGKTMLLCGIIDELLSAGETHDRVLSYFFCQATDARINNALAVLRGLVYLLASQRPSLVQYIQKKYDDAGKALFEDTNAWVALSEILAEMLRDPSLEGAYLVVDALDECVGDLPALLDLIVRVSAPRVKWIVSSRNWPQIEEQLCAAGQTLSLELNADSVATAVAVYIQYKVGDLAKRKKYRPETREAVQHYLSLNAQDTFLWVALVCQELGKVSQRKAVTEMGRFPPGLDAMYSQMLAQICEGGDAVLCKRILGLVATCYRPVSLEECAALAETPEETIGDIESMQEIVGLCGSFLTIRDSIVSFVHQSAKDFLLTTASSEIFPFGMGEIHHTISSRSLDILTATLRRDIYDLNHPGFTIDQVSVPDPDPLVTARYSCVYWVDHLYDCDPSNKANKDLRDEGSVDKFLRRSYLYWLEALSLLRSMPKGILSMTKLNSILQVRPIHPYLRLC